MANLTCPKCGELREGDAVWIVDFRGTQETPEEGHYQCCFCGSEITED